MTSKEAAEAACVGLYEAALGRGVNLRSIRLEGLNIRLKGLDAARIDLPDEDQEMTAEEAARISDRLRNTSR
ncbi:hypothetical protein ACFYY2_12030 [Streptomyces sp. NPDC001822]|uniref:hypothetical protein n=1 Tax=Streptomyces sp. NPDC001822 TaxID=3364614 RepID=UPI0036CF7C75